MKYCVTPSRGPKSKPGAEEKTLMCAGNCTLISGIGFDTKPSYYLFKNASVRYR
jgi:hypothetical protein